MRNNRKNDMAKIIKKLFIVVSVVVLTTSCSDDLFDFSGKHADESGIQFTMTTEEMGHEVVNTGGSRAGLSVGTPDEGDRFTERTLEGDNPWGLKVHRMPEPLMGFNRGAVKAGVAGDAGTSGNSGNSCVSGVSRAGANEVVSGITNFHDSLTIWGFTDNATLSEATLFDQILLTKVRNWRNSVEWPYGNGNYMKFYAVAPSLESINMSATGESFSTPPQLTYTLPEKPNELLDVLYGESENISIAAGPPGSVTTNPSQENLGKDNKFVNLQFRHITTAVRFAQGTIPARLTIKSISIEGSQVTGTYNPATTDAATATRGAWSFAGDAAKRTYTVTADHVGTGAAGASYVPITGTPTLFLLPQTLPTGATLRVVLIDTGNSNKEHTLTCNIAGDIWKKGFTVTYKITIGQLKEGFILEADTDIKLEHSNNAVSSNLAVRSYQLYYDYSSGAQVPSYSPVTWNVDGVSSDGTSFVTWASKPASLSWLTDFRGVLDGSVYVGGYNATASFTVAGQEMKYTADHDEVLSENSKTGASTLDLSQYYPYEGGGHYKNSSNEDIQQPANCYIVNRIGSYYFPAVYGNMTADNASQKSCFKDHLGATITKYLIKEQLGALKDTEAAGKTAAEVPYLWSTTTYGPIEPTVQVVLLWQDVKGLITSPTYSESQNQIGFTVSQSTPGNAVLALQVRKVTFTGKFGGSSTDTPTSINYGPWETVWTWHIWMTDEVYRNSGVEDDTSFDAFYVNGSKNKERADHIATLQDYTTPSTTYQILPVDLGWVPDNNAFGLYEPRSVWVKLKQTGSNNTAVVKITQNARQQLYTGTGTVYQWGRPTAFPSLRTVTGSVRSVYDITNKDITSQFVLAQATSGTGFGGDAISNPFGVLQWETNPNSWFDVNNADYATANAMWNSSTKTVYDPCPPGFRVPPARVFYVLSKTGTTIKSGAGQLNMWPDEIDLNGVTQKNGERSKGGYFYCKANETKRYGDMVYMPATGEWHGNKSVGTQLQDRTEQLNQTNGLFWTSDYYNNADSKACVLWITPEYTFSAGTADKPVIGFFDAKTSGGAVDATNKLNYYSNLRGIRPLKQ